MCGCCSSNPASNISPDTPWKNVLIARGLKTNERSLEGEIGDYEFNLWSKNKEWNKFIGTHFDWYMFAWPEWSQTKREYFMLRENDYIKLLSLAKNKYIDNFINSIYILIKCKTEGNVDVIVEKAYPTRYKKIFLSTKCLQFMANKLGYIDIENKLNTLVAFMLENIKEFNDITQTQIEEMCQLIFQPRSIKNVYKMKQNKKIAAEDISNMCVT
eukprot:241723_1